MSGGATGQELAIAQRQGWVLRWLNRILILGVLVALLASHRHISANNEVKNGY